MRIALCTLNARYAHASLGLRYLRANLAEFRDQSEILEFTIGQKTEDVVEAILRFAPTLIGFGVYIWNRVESERVLAQLKLLAPEMIVVLGGPEVSYEIEAQSITALADHVITGWGDISFRELVAARSRGEIPPKVIAGKQPPLAEIAYPYQEYSELDLRQRVLYLEASRGCPFKCEFCLSALDKTAWPFALESFLGELEQLYRRGARTFKFVDRTFNLKVDTSLRILEFFKAKLERFPDDAMFVHFELVPDHLPERLKAAIAAFPAGVLQFEIGIQSFNPEVQKRISRRQDNALAKANLKWLREHSKAHLHVDLIAGLPGENLQSFGEGFDQLVALAPHEIQFGILKRLRGTPIIRHTGAFALRFNPEPPYNILCNSELDFQTMQRLTRFARFWDLFYNSGRFATVMPMLLGEQPFMRFLAFSDWLYEHAGKTHAIALERLVHALYLYLCEQGFDAEHLANTLQHDYQQSGGRAVLRLGAESKSLGTEVKRAQPVTPKRQRRHLEPMHAMDSSALVEIRQP
jgi:radical SAM superfamily enzyme YgiQ (UPF0313 family)